MTPECAPDFTYLSTGLSLLDNIAKFYQSRTYLFPKCAALTLFKILSRKPIVQEQTFDQRTNGPVNAHLISWPSKAQNIQNLEKIYGKEMTLTFNTHIPS